MIRRTDNTKIDKAGKINTVGKINNTEIDNAGKINTVGQIDNTKIDNAGKIDTIGRIDNNIVMEPKLHKAYIALGSNIGDPIANVRAAIKKISEFVKLGATSSLYRTKPWGYLDQPDFINAVISIETDYSPQQLLAQLKKIEKDMGKEKPAERWGPRIIDLDILTFGQLNIAESGLNIPHPRMLERAFVLAPLAEIDSSYAEALAKLPEALRLEVMRL